MALIRTQPPCVTASGTQPCLQFRPADFPTNPIRSFSFNAPGAGTAAVSITGSMFCEDADDVVTQRVVDIVAQIVPMAGSVPNIHGPGALRHGARIGAPAAADGLGLSTTFNLASTRVFAINAAGLQQYHFKIRNQRMDGRIRCTIYDAAFTVIFIPRP